MKTYEDKKKTKNGVKRLIFCVIAILVEFAVILLTVTRINNNASIIGIIVRVVSIVLVLVIYSQNKNSAFKLSWIIVIVTFPVFGLVFYLLIGLNRGTMKMRKRYEKIDSETFPLLPSNSDVLEYERQEYPQAAGISRYLMTNAGYPVYKNTRITYYADALSAIREQISEIKKAESFIFMEYHAIENKESWKMVQQALIERVNAGVDVRVFYDDLGSITFITKDFVVEQEALGIKCRVFNPFMPGINMFLNNRDHRKITVIDGKVAFTGGYNIANEYFNITQPYGRWKDTGVKLEGEAVKSLTATFLEMWNAVKAHNSGDKDISRFLIDYACVDANSYIQPYADNPMDYEQTGENVYISILNKAEKYCWFTTPYLIVTDEMISALTLAAKRGVDVRIITPGVPDKRFVYQVTRSFYPVLVKNGVRIFEWTPGFLHAKMCVSDDYMATCGTFNLDYRSFYHHFENGVFMVGDPVIQNMKTDMRACMDEAKEVTSSYKKGIKAYLRAEQLILRLFAAFL